MIKKILLSLPVFMMACAPESADMLAKADAPAEFAEARCGDDDDDAETITLSGKVYVFQTRDFLPYATITIEEYPSFSATTDLSGDWSIEGLPSGKKLTPKVSFPNALYAAIGVPAFQDMHQQTFKTEQDIELLYFQAVPQAAVVGLAALIGLAVDPNACQIVTTITDPDMADVSTWEEFDAFVPHGLAEMTAKLSGAHDLPAPVYFSDSVLPDLSLSASSGDGGVMWVNVPAEGKLKIKVKDSSGEWEFDKIRVDCQAGRFINASPPWGATGY